MSRMCSLGQKDLEDVSQILCEQTKLKSFLLGKVFLWLTVKVAGMKVSKCGKQPSILGKPCSIDVHLFRE